MDGKELQDWNAKCIQLGELLGALSYRERRILELRLGLGGESEHSLEEVAATFKVTPERVRQYENQSLKKLDSLAR
jgi:RNA polymerase primary sigma factor